MQSIQPIRAAARAATTFALVLIRAYQAFVRPQLVGTCKFHPSCSEYASEALMRFGLWRGGRLAAARLLRCHPFSPGGLDPVPPPPCDACGQTPGR
ncbi:MAG: membrane protein insertion efficiency factor YidD [Phycisphaerales bacterium]|nr:MAG: membrane protein insertion efficiency factor YidD [Phycisphaerales bacterium]